MFCNFKIFFDPLLTQNGTGAGRAEWKQRKIRRANGGKKHKSEPKQLRFALETTSFQMPMAPSSFACPEMDVSVKGAYAPGNRKMSGFMDKPEKPCYTASEICGAVPRFRKDMDYETFLGFYSKRVFRRYRCCWRWRRWLYTYLPAARSLRRWRSLLSRCSGWMTGWGCLLYWRVAASWQPPVCWI